jgi:hypothetical protein
MACDPFGSRLYLAPTPEANLGGTDRHWVRILLELCDPCEAYEYRIDDVRVSDFILHQYGNGITGPYDILGKVHRAREVLDGGFISWVEPDGTWKQIINFYGSPEVVTLGKPDPDDKRSPREWVEANGGDRE